MRDLQSVDERECRDVLTAFGDLCQLALKVVDVKFEIITMPHFDGEKMMVVPLNLPTRCISGEEHFRHLLEVVERMWRQRVELI